MLHILVVVFWALIFVYISRHGFMKMPLIVGGIIGCLFLIVNVIGDAGIFVSFGKAFEMFLVGYDITAVILIFSGKEAMPTPYVKPEETEDEDVDGSGEDTDTEVDEDIEEVDEDMDEALTDEDINGEDGDDEETELSEADEETENLEVVDAEIVGIDDDVVKVVDAEIIDSEKRR